MTTAAVDIRTPADIRRAKVIAIVYLLLAGFTLFVFGTGSEGSTTFVLSRPTDSISLPDLTVSGSTLGYVVAAILAFLGAQQWMRGFGSKTNLVLAIGMGLNVGVILTLLTPFLEGSVPTFPLIYFFVVVGFKMVD